MRFRTTIAWAVHLYTALGLVVAAAITLLLFRGGDKSFRNALALMVLATVIDSTDGWLARRAQVKEHAPSFDGRKLDDLVDFLNYTCLPLVLIWRAQLIPEAQAWWLLLPLLASAYGFSQANAKTDDGFFLGFPSYWNVVAFYLYLLRPASAVSLAVITVFSILTFIPWRYLYPSQKGPLSYLTNALAGVWAILLLMAVAGWPNESRLPAWISLAFPIYYLLVSWVMTARRKT